MASTMEQAFHELAARLSNVEQLTASVDIVNMKTNMELVIDEMKKVRARLHEVERKDSTGHLSKKKLRDVKSQDVEKYDGDTDKYEDWSFSVNTFLDDHDILYHDLLELVEQSDDPFELSDLDDYAVGCGVSEEYTREMSRELWGFLIGKVRGNARIVLCNMKKQNPDLRALLAWQRLYRDSYGTKEARIAKLSDSVTNPKRVTKKTDLATALDFWEKNLHEYERLKGVPHCEYAAVTGLKNLVPVELSRLLETTQGLRRLQAALTYVREQAKIMADHVKYEPAKRAPAVASSPSPDPNAMDTSLMEQYQSEQQSDQTFGEDSDHCDYDVNALSKGKGKGSIKGECWNCGVKGHRSSECRKGAQESYKGGKGWQHKGVGKSNAHQHGMQAAPWHWDPYHHQPWMQFWGHPSGFGKGGKGYVSSAKGYGKGVNNIDGANHALCGGDAQYWPGVQPAQQSQTPPNVGSICHLGLEPAYVNPGEHGQVSSRWVSRNPFAALEEKDELDIPEAMADLSEFPVLSGARARKPARPWRRNPDQRWRPILGRVDENLSDAGTQSLNLLTQHEESANINAVVDGYEENECVIDSGAADNVAPPSIGRGYNVVESEGSRRGQYYLTADGNRLPNQGQKRILAESGEGNVFNMNFQIAGVTRPLMSVGKVCDRGNIVTFDSTGGYITNAASGMATRFERKNGVYVLTTWARVPSSGSPPPSDFHRQG